MHTILRTLPMAILLLAGGMDVAANPGSDVKGSKAEKSKPSESSSKDSLNGYHVLRKVKLGGDGGWDYLTIDSAARRLYIARSNRVMIIDIDNDKVVGEIASMEGVHGVTVVPELKKGFITCGKADLVKIFDLETLKIVGQAPTGTKPDASLYDPASKRVFAFNNKGCSATAIDAATNKVAGQIELGGEPESAVSDGKGKVYVNLESKNQIAVIDTQKLKLISTWSVAPGDEPTGLAFDAKHRRLFSGCHNSLMIILDADSGKVIKTLPIGKRVDAAGFDDESQDAFCSNGEGSVTVVHETDPKTFSVLENIKTQAAARTCALDSKKHQIWTVSATPKTAAAAEDPDDAPAPKKGEHRRREYEPDSFAAIVIGK